ncbi:MAG: insulinase family protein, partial [Cyanobacteria bacterium P01_E01_bin.43]
MTSSPPVDRPLLQRRVLNNGLVVIVLENPVADIVSARLLVKAGTGHEARSQAGLFSLMSSLLTKGTRHLSSLEIAEQVESIGASLGSDASADYSLV